MPNDPNSYFQSYGRQIRAHSAQYAAGDPQSTRRNPFPSPDYYGKPRLGASLKTTFNNGALPDPVNYQPSSTFHALFHSPPDVARAAAGHVVLEGPSGQDTKQRMGLPYSPHSIVDPLKSAAFDGGLRALMNSGLRKEDGFITGSMSLLGSGKLGRESNDIDFVLNSQGRSRLRELGHSPTDNNSWQSFNIGKIEAWDRGGHGAEDAEEDFLRAEDRHGWKVQRPSRALELKSRLNRPKDQRDLEELGYKTQGKLGDSYERSESGLAVPKHVNLETDSAQKFIRPALWGGQDPYNTNSTVNSIRAAAMMAKSEFQKTFGKSLLDTATERLASFVTGHVAGKSLLRRANTFVGQTNRTVGRAIRKNPALYHFAQRIAAHGEEFGAQGDFGKAWGDLHASLADLAGFRVRGTSGVGPGSIRASELLLKNVVGPYLLLGLTFVPLVVEVGTHIKHALHKRVAKNMAEEHHNLETPTGRHLKDIMGLPYQGHSIIDLFKTLKFPTLLRRAEKTVQREVEKAPQDPKEILHQTSRKLFGVEPTSKSEDILKAGDAFGSRWIYPDGNISGQLDTHLSSLESLSEHLGEKKHSIESFMEHSGLVRMYGSQDSVREATYDRPKTMVTGQVNVQINSTITDRQKEVIEKFTRFAEDRGGIATVEKGPQAMGVLNTRSNPISAATYTKGTVKTEISQTPLLSRNRNPWASYASKERAYNSDTYYRTPSYSKPNFVPEAVPKHVNLEGPSAQALKERLGLPYQGHSIVDLNKATQFPTLAKGRPGRAEVLSTNEPQIVLRGKKMPTLFANEQGFSETGLHQALGVFVPNIEFRYLATEMFRDPDKQVRPGEQMLLDSYKRLVAQGEGTATVINLGLGADSKMIREAQRHEHHHKMQSLLGEVDHKIGAYQRPETITESPYFPKFSKAAQSLGYPEAQTTSEVGAFAASGARGRASVGIGEFGALDFTYRISDDLMRRQGAQAGRDLFESAVPVPKGLTRVLSMFSQAERDSIKENVGTTAVATMFQKFLHQNPEESTPGSFGARIQGQFQDYLKSTGASGPSMEMHAAMDAAGHVNLESPTGRFLKKVLALPYHEFSTVDVSKAAEFFKKVAQAFRTGIGPVIEAADGSKQEFPQVNDFVNRMEKLYPHLIKKPRRVLRALYDLQTSAYAYFAQHQNVYLSTFARTMLMAEKVEHVMDYTYKFSPNRQAAKLFRAAVGAKKRDYEGLAMKGIEEGVEYAMQRRIVHVVGVALGLTETVFGYLHTKDKLLKLWHKFFAPDQDPEQKRNDQLERDRRKGYRAAQRLGQKYDPTLPARQRAAKSGHESLLSEVIEQLNPFAAAGRFVKAIRDPKKHVQSLTMYGAFAVLMGVTAAQAQGKVEKNFFKGLAHGVEHEMEHGGLSPGAGKFAYRFLAQGFHNLGPGMKLVTAIGGLTGFVFGKSSSARAGAFSNLIATYLADTAGQWAGEKIMSQKGGQKFAGQLAMRIGEIPEYLDIKNEWLSGKAKEFTEAGKILYDAGTGVVKTGLTAVDRLAEERVFLATKSAAGRIGMEVGGVILEGSLLIPIRKWLKGFGHHLDQSAGLRHARNIGTQIDRKERKDRQEKAKDDSDLRRYLSTFSAAAFSNADLLSNTDYDYSTRAALFAARHTQVGRAALDTISPVVTITRRIKSGARAIFTTRNGGKRQKEDWRVRLTRSYNAPAYSQVDITSNPQYNVSQRMFLMGLSHTVKGGDFLETISPTVTHTRRIGAWVEGLRHPHELGEHAVTHAVRHGHHAVRHVVAQVDQKAHQNAATGAAADMLHTFAGAANDSGQVIQDAQKSSKKRQGKVKVRSHARTKDHALDEGMLHNAYSRYINYGHEGDALAYNDQQSN